MFLKRHTRRKNGKRHIYYSLCESLRLSSKRVVQRRLLNLGELNTTQLERWQRSIEVIEEDGASTQKRLFTDKEGQAPEAEDICEVRLSTLRVRKAREFGACWLGCRLFEELQLQEFFGRHLKEHRGPEDWAKVVELLVVNRLCQPGSELSIHEKWFGGTAMDHLLGCGPGVAGKDRLYRALDKILPLKPELEKHLGQRWRDLFGADTEVLLYDLTSTYFEGSAEGVEQAARGYSRDHRPDCQQLVLALVVTTEGLPLSYELFPGNTHDASTLRQIIDQVEDRYGSSNRIWVFDRGLVSQENLDVLNERQIGYLVGTPRHRLDEFQKELLAGDWQKVQGRPGVQVQLIEKEHEIYVLARSQNRAQKELAMRRRVLGGLSRGLRALSRSVREGRLRDQRKIDQRLGLGVALPPAGRGRTFGSELAVGLPPSTADEVARWSLPVAEQHGAGGSPDPMEAVCAADRGGGGFSGIEVGAEDPPAVAPDRSQGRGSCDGGLPRVCALGLLEAEAAQGGRFNHPGPGPGDHAVSPHGGSVVWTARWTTVVPAAGYRTGTRTTPPAPPPGLEPPRTTPS